MSWDITLTEKKLEEVEVADIGDYTYNVSKMYKKAMGKTMSDFHGKRAKDILDIITKGYQCMVSNEEEYKHLNPVNGWGNYHGAVDYLDKLIKSCEEHPNAIVNVN